MTHLKGNVVIGQSGGPTAVINQSLIGIIEELAGSPQIGKVLGAHHAISGIIKNDNATADIICRNTVMPSRFARGLCSRFVAQFGWPRGRRSELFGDLGKDADWISST